MQFPAEVNADAIKRLRRLEGQIRGLQRMIENQEPCRDIVTQLAASKGALDRVGFRLMSAALAEPREEHELDELERLFLKLS